MIAPVKDGSQEGCCWNNSCSLGLRQELGIAYVVLAGQRRFVIRKISTAALPSRHFKAHKTEPSFDEHFLPELKHSKRFTW